MEDVKYDYLMYAPAVGGGSVSLLGLGLPDVISILIIISLIDRKSVV